MDLVINLIHGDTSNSPGKATWNYGIVANDINAIDVDKIDYIMRDSYMLGNLLLQSYLKRSKLWLE